MSTFRPIESSALRFIWEEDPNLVQTDKNVLANEYDFINKLPTNLTRIINQADNEWWQFRTDYVDVVTELYDCEGNITTLTNTLVRSEDLYNYYEVELDTSALDGYYYVRHSMETDEDKPIVHFRSDWVQINESFDNTMVIEWYGSDANEIPMQWDGTKTQQLRLVSDIRTYAAGNLLSTMRGSDNNIVPILSNPLNTRYLNIPVVDQFTAEKINIAVGHDKFYVNGQQFVTDEPIDIGEVLGDTTAYSFKIKLEEIDYLNYASDPTLTGTLPVVPEMALQFDTDIGLQFDTDIALRFQ